MNPKEVAGTWAANHLVKQDMKVGLGTGSTAYFAIRRIGELVAEGLSVTATATSVQTEQLATSWNIPLMPLDQIGELDLTIDGADEITPELHLIKGGGGALFREKMVAMRSEKLIIIADPSKPVKLLGQFPLPVEVVPFGHILTFNALSGMGLNPVLRRIEGDQEYVTDNHNLIYDCHIGEIQDPVSLHHALKAMTGVVDTGLFLGMASQAVIGREDGSVEILTKN